MMKYYIGLKDSIEKHIRESYELEVSANEKPKARIDFKYKKRGTDKWINGDKFGKLKGLRGRVLFLSFILSLQGIMLISFSGATSLVLGVVLLILFSLSVQMAEGATFSVVPFINKKAIGSVSGIVGAGGNVGAFLAAMLLKSKSSLAEKAAIVSNEGLGDEVIKAAQSAASSSAVANGYLLIGFVVVATGIAALAIKFSTEEEDETEKINGLSPELIPIKVKR